MPQAKKQEPVDEFAQFRTGSARASNSESSGHDPQDEFAQFRVGNGQEQTTAPTPSSSTWPSLPGMPSPMPRELQAHPENRPLFTLPLVGPVGTRDTDQGMVSQGLHQAGAGVAAMTRPGFDNKAGAASQVVRGLGTAATPAMIPIAAMSPFNAALAAGTGYVGGKLLRSGAEAMNAGPGMQDLAEDTGNIIGGGVKVKKIAGSIGKNTTKTAQAFKGFTNPEDFPPTGPSGSNVGPLDLVHAAHSPTMGGLRLLTKMGDPATWSNRVGSAYRATQPPALGGPVEYPGGSPFEHPDYPVDIEQPTGGGHQSPPTYGGPSPQGPVSSVGNLRDIESGRGFGSGNGGGPGNAGDLVVPQHYAGHSNPTAAHALDTKVISQKIPPGMNPDAITPGQLNQWRKELGHAPLKVADEAVRLKQLKQTLAATRSR